MKRIVLTLLTSSLMAGPMAGFAASFVIVEPSEANYRIREQLAGLRFPNDAVGATTVIEGTVTLNDDGTVRAGSLIVVDLASITSDQARRDGFVRNNTLQTSRFPTATFAPAVVEGLPTPLPPSQPVDVVIRGALTVRDVTFPVTWLGTASFDGGVVLLEAATTFTFDEASLTKPRVASVLSVDDDITLEVRLVLEPTEE